MYNLIILGLPNLPTSPNPPSNFELKSRGEPHAYFHGWIMLLVLVPIAVHQLLWNMQNIIFFLFGQDHHQLLTCHVL